MKTYGNIPKTLLNAAQKDGRIAELSNEGEDGYWLIFATGFRNTESGAHGIHERTARECIDALKYIKPCNCEDCVKGA